MATNRRSGPNSAPRTGNTPRHPAKSLNDRIAEAVGERKAKLKSAGSPRERDEARYIFLRRKQPNVDRDWGDRLKTLAGVMRVDAKQTAELLKANNITPRRTQAGVSEPFWPVYESQLYSKTRIITTNKDAKPQPDVHATKALDIAGIGIVESGELIRFGSSEAWKQTGLDSATATDLDLAAIGLIDMDAREPLEQHSSLIRWQEFLAQLAGQAMVPGGHTYTPQGSLTVERINIDDQVEKPKLHGPPAASGT